MKKAKRLFALALALALSLALCAPALADGENATATCRITINAGDESEKHQFNAYQIFSGTLSNDGKTLSDIKWGSGVNTNTTTGEGENTKTLIDDIKAINVNNKEPFKDCSTAAEVAAELGKEKDDSEVAKKFAEVVVEYLSDTKTAITSVSSSHIYTATDMPVGYYVIKDETTDTNIKASDLMLKLVGNVTINAKVDVATVNKYAGEEVLKDNTSYGLDDIIPYTLVGTLPADFQSNGTGSYKYEFTDTMDTHLSPAGDWNYSQNEQTTVTAGVTVKIDEEDVTESFKITYTNNTLTVSIENLRSITGVNLSKDSKITVTYNAQLISLPENTKGISNTVKVTYDTNTVTTTVTETVFPVNLVIDKVDSATTTTNSVKHLAGAEFILSRTNQNNGNEITEYLVIGEGTMSWVQSKDDATTLITDKDGKIEIKGLAVGTYNLIETEAPDGYNQLDEPVVLVVSGEVVTDTTDGSLKLEGLGLTVDEEKGTVDENTNTVTATIGNAQGAKLPSTGGIGTTIFYVLGGILVVGAAVLLITRKRMSAE